MKIRAGYEISYDCSQPTPMILTLSVFPSRTPDLLSWDRMWLDPAIPVNTYHDSFGNFCHVIRAPVGRWLRLQGRARRAGAGLGLAFRRAPDLTVGRRRDDGTFDISERKRVQTHVTMLGREAEHRAKNMLATVEVMVPRNRRSRHGPYARRHRQRARQCHGPASARPAADSGEGEASTARIIHRIVPSENSRKMSADRAAASWLCLGWTKALQSPSQ
jgi:hypothetical protein